MSNRITACLIVRDEEKHLADCLESIKGFVDEIVIVDTGSKDKTVEIAKSFGARVEVHPWQDNFALHRNQSLDMATMQWILYIDADERVFEGDGEKIKEYLSNCKTGLAYAYVINSAPNGNETYLRQVRIIKRGEGFKYTGRIHNRLQIELGYEIGQSPLRIKHLGYDLTPEDTAKKHNRTKTLLELEMKEFPDDANLMEHYAKHHRLEGEHKDPKVVMKYSAMAAGITDPRQHSDWWVHLRSLNLLSWSLLEMGKPKQAIETAQHLLSFKQNHLDAMLTMAFAYSHLNMLKASITWFSNYIKASQTYDPMKDADGAQVSFPNLQKMAIQQIKKLNKALNSPLPNRTDKRKRSKV